MHVLCLGQSVGNDGMLTKFVGLYTSDPQALKERRYSLLTKAFGKIEFQIRPIHFNLSFCMFIFFFIRV